MSPAELGRRRPGRTADAALAAYRDGHPVRRHTAGGVEWSYRIGGSGTSTMLYLPGGAGHAEAAFGYLSRLERNHRVIAVDYPNARSMRDLAGGLAAVMDAERVERADVWGNSFGGMVAQVLVRWVPDRVASLVLSNTAAPESARATLDAVEDFLHRRSMKGAVS